MFKTQIKYLVCIIMGTSASNAVMATPECSTNANGEIIDTDSCEFDAISLTYYVKDILWCTDLPTPGDFNACESWDISPFTFTITEDSVTSLETFRDLPKGTYTWNALVIEPRYELKAVATFSRAMQGATGSGKICWTNGATINHGTSLWREPDRSKWMADCGSQVPENIQSNAIIFNNTMFGPGSFLSSYDSVMPDGSRTVGYLLNSAGNLATTYLEVTTYVSLHKQQLPVVVTGDPKKIGIFDITYDRSRGAWAFIDSTLGSNNLSRISHGSFTVTGGYQEISTE